MGINTLLLSVYTARIRISKSAVTTDCSAILSSEKQGGAASPAKRPKIPIRAESSSQPIATRHGVAISWLISDAAVSHVPIPAGAFCSHAGYSTVLAKFAPFTILCHISLFDAAAYPK